MDATAFGLSRDPFQRSPELDDACVPNSVAALLSELQSSLDSPQGLSVLVGDPGSGTQVAAAAFARRLSSQAHVALLTRPTSSLSAIARDAVRKLESPTRDHEGDDDWVAVVRGGARRRAVSGRSTVIILEGAERLSPQTLEGLAELFGTDESLPLHLFLVGQPRLLDRMHSGPERALHPFLLQICQMDPLGVRESVRYLERRLAICGGRLTTMFSPEAIDAIVQKAEGRVLWLERLAAEALDRAARRCGERVERDDVAALTEGPGGDEEEEAMARGDQQDLQFDLSDDDAQAADEAGDWNEDEGDQWDADADEDQDEDWSAGDDSDDGADWQAGHDEDEDDSRAAADGGRGEYDDEYDDEDDDVPAGLVAAAEQGPSGRRRLVGTAVLSICAGLGLVWAANHLPERSSESAHSRDAMPFTEPLTVEPEEILRLASTAEDADANGHLDAWIGRPEPAPAEKAEAAQAEPASALETPRAEPVAVAAKASGGTAAGGTAAAPTPARQAEPVGRAAEPVQRQAEPVQRVAEPVRLAVQARPAAPVFTVQLGAFKARRNAEQLATRLRDGKGARIVEEGGLYRVVSGSFSRRQDALSHQASLRRAGYSTFVRSATF